MVGSFRYLSDTILSDLPWTQHIRNTTKAVKQHIGTLHWKLNQATPPARLTKYLQKFYPAQAWLLCVSLGPPPEIPHWRVQKTQKFVVKVISKWWNSDSYRSLMEDFKLQPLKTRRTNQTRGVLQYLKLLLYSLIHSPLVISTIRSFLLLLPKLIPTNHPFL